MRNLQAILLASTLTLMPACEAFVPSEVSEGIAYLQEERKATSVQVDWVKSELARLSAGKDVPWLSESDKLLLDAAIARQAADLAAAQEKLAKLDALEPEVEAKSKEVASLAIQEQLWMLAQYALGVLGVGVGGAFLGTRRKSAADKGRMLSEEIIQKVNDIRGPPTKPPSGGGGGAVV